MSKITLDSNQKQAIDKSQGQLLIVACPGAGKTTTLLHRINNMIEIDGVNPRNILMVTFTKSAATEMEERFSRSFGKTGVTFRTIHGHCYWIMRVVTGKSPAIISEAEQNQFLMSLIRFDKNIDDKQEWVRDIKLEISNYKVSRERQTSYIPRTFKDKKVLFKILEKYERYKDTKGLWDFEDLLIKTYDYLTSNPQVLNRLKERFKYILVDEFQDVNTLQRDLIYIMAGENGNLSVAGDDDQAIYGFQGASPEIMLQFRKEYPNARIVKISNNYRSQEEIVHIASNIIRNNERRFAKDFISFRGGKGKVLVRNESNRLNQAKYIVDEIRQKMYNGQSPEDMAIIYRGNWQGRMFIRMLSEAKIPFNCRDVFQDAYSHWIFTDMMAYMNIAKGCQTKDDIERVLNRPNRYLRERGLLDKGLNLSHMIDVINSSDLEDWQKSNCQDRVEEFFFFVKKLRQEKAPGKLLEIIDELGQYSKFLKEFAEYSGGEEEELQDIFSELKNDASKCKDMDSWLSYKDRKRVMYDNSGGVTLSTMHSAKGLEWSNVYIIDCADTICPSKKSLKGSKENRQMLAEEERRLFYVAVTRAKDELTLIYPKTISGKSLKISPYLIESGLVAQAPKPKGMGKSSGTTFVRRIPAKELK